MIIGNGNGYECVSCGADLVGRQRRFCSERCRSAYRVREFRGPRHCTVCGVRLESDNRGKRCRMSSGMDENSPAYSARARAADDAADVWPSDACYQRQESEILALREAADARDFPLCAFCGEETEYAGSGRHRKYCSAKCRVYAHRARRGRRS